AARGRVLDARPGRVVRLERLGGAVVVAGRERGGDLRELGPRQVEELAELRDGRRGGGHRRQAGQREGERDGRADDRTRGTTTTMRALEAVWHLRDSSVDRVTSAPR